MTEFSDEEVTRLQVHSSKGGEHEALRKVVALLRSKAGAAFADNRDDEATVIRDMAEEIEKLRKVASAELDAMNKERRGSS